MTEVEEIKYISNLLIKQLHNTLNPSEIEVLQTWISQSTRNEALANRLLAEEHIQKQLQNINQTKALIESQLVSAGRNEEFSPVKRPEKNIERADKRINSLKTNLRIAVAASLLVIGSIAINFYTNQPQAIPSKETILQASHDIPPGGNRATLSLADGSTINLSDDQNKIIINSDLIQYSDGSIINDQGSLQNFALTTPKGGQYQIILSDGTKVWLNAATSLKYPNRFSGKERIVELTGEAYFEVSPNKQMPFIVKSANQEVKVLGTHFNINSYADEESLKTTLLEGSVKINYSTGSSTILKPGEQARFKNNQLEVFAVNVKSVIAWKNNEFIFESESIENVMKMIERWYNVDVIYTSEKTTQRFSGTVSRFDKLSKVLEIVELTGEAHFKVKDRTVYVSK